jgi:hypothetical protein
MFIGCFIKDVHTLNLSGCRTVSDVSIMGQLVRFRCICNTISGFQIATTGLMVAIMRREHPVALLQTSLLWKKWTEPWSHLRGGRNIFDNVVV